MKRQIILDTETTGLSPQEGHRLIEVGGLEMVNRRLTGNRFHTYINPERIVDEGAVKVHGLTFEFLKEKPVFAKIADDLFSFLDGAELVIHNAPFDIGFLNFEFAQYKKSVAPITQFCAVVDTLTIARREHPGQQNTLDALCRRYGVNNKHRDLHGALIDAALLGEVYLLMTGGQSQLFSQDAGKKDELEKSIMPATESVNIDLPVIYASSAELSAHEKMMTRYERQ